MSSYLEQGWILFRLGRYKESLPLFERARTMEPNSAVPVTGIASAWLELGHTKKAIQHAQSALGLNPNYWFAHDTLGRAWGEEGDLVKAENHVREALRIEPNISDLYAHLGRIFLRTKRYPEAERQARLGMALDPGDLGCREVLILSQYHQKKLVDAEQTATETLRLHPENSDAHRLPAFALVHLERYVSARDHARESLRINPESASAREIYVFSLKNQYPLYSAVVKFGMQVRKVLDNRVVVRPLMIYPPCFLSLFFWFFFVSLLSEAVADIAFGIKLETRQVLTPGEIRAVPWYIAALLFAFTAFVTGWIKSSEYSVILGVNTILMLRPIGVLCRSVEMRRWNLLKAASVVTGVVIVAAYVAQYVVQEDLMTLGIWLLLVMLGLCYWASRSSSLFRRKSKDI